MKNEQQVPDKKFLIGEWGLDSSTNHLRSYDKLFFLEDGSVYEFYRSDGGSFRRFTLMSLDTILTEYDEKLSLHRVDSNTIKVSGEYSQWTNYYKRRGGTGYLDYNLQADSMRSLCLGWWTLKTPAMMPIEMPNYNKWCTSFTMHVRDDGQTEFYLDNNLDSIVRYDYIARPDGLSLQYLCVVGHMEIPSVDSNRMSMIWQTGLTDTLQLERLHVIR